MVTHTTVSHTGVFRILMLIDGIALAIIVGSTLLEGMEDWETPLSLNYPSNTYTIFFWLSGLWLCVFGLIFVMANAAAFEGLPTIEHMGMAMLTSAPILNTCGWMLLDVKDPTYKFHQELLCTELLEFVGMSLLDLSYFSEGIPSLAIELFGYLTLIGASLLDVTYIQPEQVGEAAISGMSSASTFVLSVSIRQASVHWAEAVGIFFLAVVATGKFLIETDEHNPHQLENKASEITQDIENRTTHSMTPKTKATSRKNAQIMHDHRAVVSSDHSNCNGVSGSHPCTPGTRQLHTSDRQDRYVDKDHDQ